MKKTLFPSAGWFSLLFLLVFALPRGAAAAYQMPITFSGYSGRSETLTNFPVLVVLSNNVGGSGFDYGTLLSPSGWDLRFKTNLGDTGTDTLNYEIESWNPSGASYVWVRVPAIPANGSGAIWATWGNGGDSGQLPCTTNGTVWASGYAGVWHMQTNSVADATTNQLNATSYGTVDTGGRIGTAQSFSGSTYAYVSDTPDNPRLDVPKLTIEFWMKAPAAQWFTYCRPVDRKWDGAFCVARNASATTAGFWCKASGPVDSQIAVFDDTWHYVAFTFDGAASVAYADGLSRGTAYPPAGDIPAQNDIRLTFGANYGSGENYVGALDEIRMSRIARSADWLWASYQNMASNAAFNAFGTAVQQASGAPDVDSGVGATGLTVNAAFLTAGLLSTGTSAATWGLCWGTNNPGLTRDPAQWLGSGAGTTNLDLPGSLPATNSVLVTGLASGQTYNYRVWGVNASGTNWSTLASFAVYQGASADNASGAANVTKFTAILRGTVLTGVPTPHVYVYRGTTDGGTTPPAWNLPMLALGPEPIGPFSVSVVGLTPGQQYWYRCMVSNEVSGAVWAGASSTFTTLTSDPAAYTWTGLGTDGKWDTLANWTGGTAYPDDPLASATFNAGTSQQPNINGNVTLNTFHVTGSAAWTMGGSATVTVNSAINWGSSANGSTLSAVFAGTAGLTVASPSSLNDKLTYTGTASPTFAGGTVVSNNNGLSWVYPMAVAADKTVSFGTGPITLKGGRFGFGENAPSGTATFTLANPIKALSSDDNALDETIVAGIKGSANDQYTTFSGPLTVGSRVSLLNQNNLQMRLTGPVVVDQATPGRRLLCDVMNQYSGVMVEGAISDGPGTAGNSLALRADNETMRLLGGTSTHSFGTIIEDNSYARAVNLETTGPLGLGPIWIQEGGILRFNAAVQQPSGASVNVFGSGVALGTLSLAANFVPALTPDSSGLLAIDTNGFTAVSSLAALGNGRMRLGSTIANATFTGGTLAPGADNTYRLGGGGGTLSIANGVLTGSGNALQVGSLTAGSGGTAKLLAANTYSNGTTVNVNSKLEGQAQVGATPFGSTNAGVTLNSGTLQLNGANAAATTAIGLLTVNGYGGVNVSQSYAPVNTLAIDQLSAGAGTAPALLAVNGATGVLGGKERITVVNGAPTVVNNMVAPWMIKSAGQATPDFLTYDNTSDGSGTIGFVSAAAGYSAVSGAGSLEALPATAMANVLNSYSQTADASVYALRLAGSYNIAASGGTRKIVLGSGGLLFGGGNNSSTIDSDISFGSAEGMLVGATWTWGGNWLTLNGKLFGTNGLTVACTAPLALEGNLFVALNGDNSGLTGTVAVLSRATIRVTKDAALGAPSNPIYLDDGSLLHYDYATPSATNARPIVLGPAGGSIENGLPWSPLPGGILTLSGPITGSGRFTMRARNAYQNGTVISNPSNTFSGGFSFPNAYFCSGPVTVRSNATLGVGDVLAGNGGTLNLYGDRNIGGGDFYAGGTNSRQARLTVNGNRAANLNNGSMNYGYANFLSAAPSVGSLSGAGVVTLANTVLTLGGDDSSTIFQGTLSQNGATTGSLHKVGSGTFWFKGKSTLLGATVVDGGTFVADGSMTGGITVNSGGTLAGSGAAGAVTLNSGATFLPGSAVTNAATTNRMNILTASSVAFNSGATVKIHAYGPTNYTQIVATGPVNLSGSTLQVIMHYKPAPTDVFYILLNRTGSAITGTFDGAPEGKLLNLGNGYFGKISYVGAGDATPGNDVRISNVSSGIPGTTIFFL